MNWKKWILLGTVPKNEIIKLTKTACAPHWEYVLKIAPNLHTYLFILQKYDLYTYTNLILASRFLEIILILFILSLVSVKAMQTFSTDAIPL
jgi:hypothetical protein